MFAAMAIQNGRILSGVLREKDMSQKEAAIVTETDPAHFCRALQNNKITLDMLERLPYRIVATFWRLWFFAYLDEDMAEMRAEKLVMARAELSPRLEERKRA